MPKTNKTVKTEASSEHSSSDESTESIIRRTTQCFSSNKHLMRLDRKKGKVNIVFQAKIDDKKEGDTSTSITPSTDEEGHVCQLAIEPSDTRDDKQYKLLAEKLDSIANTVKDLSATVAIIQRNSEMCSRALNDISSRVTKVESSIRNCQNVLKATAKPASGLTIDALPKH